MENKVWIKLVVDQEKVETENAALESMGTHRRGESERQDAVRMPRLRG